MKFLLSIIFVIYCLTLVKSDVEEVDPISENCDYFGNDFPDAEGQAIKITDIDKDQCKAECIRKPECTHFTSSEFGCFLKHADTKQIALDSKQDYEGSFCVYNTVEESRRSKKRDINVVGQSKESDNRQQSKKRSSRRKATKRQFYFWHFALSRTIETVEEWEQSENRNSRRIEIVGESTHNQK
uniref:Apple domain-containing protein n=1 Tax=Romanomermis culicivorax TaxID=13658 RepID=A0A915L347_ROMCU